MAYLEVNRWNKNFLSDRKHGQSSSMGSSSAFVPKGSVLAALQNKKQTKITHRKQQKQQPNTKTKKKLRKKKPPDKLTGGVFHLFILSVYTFHLLLFIYLSVELIGDSA